MSRQENKVIWDLLRLTASPVMARQEYREHWASSCFMLLTGKLKASAFLYMPSLCPNHNLLCPPYQGIFSLTENKLGFKIILEIKCYIWHSQTLTACILLAAASG